MMKEDIEKLKTFEYLRRKSSCFLNDLRNYNDIFREDVPFDNIKSHKKAGLRPLSEDYIFGETTAIFGLRISPLFYIL